MEKAQVTINVVMVEDQAANGQYEQIHVYADAQNVYEAASKAYQELMTALEETRGVPSVRNKLHRRYDDINSAIDAKWHRLNWPVPPLDEVNEKTGG